MELLRERLSQLRDEYQRTIDQLEHEVAESRAQIGICELAIARWRQLVAELDELLTDKPRRRRSRRNA